MKEKKLKQPTHPVFFFFLMNRTTTKAITADLCRKRKRFKVSNFKENLAT